MFRGLIRAALLSTIFVATPSWAQSGSAPGTGTATITAPAGISVISDLLVQTGITVAVVGSPGDMVSLAVPEAVNLTSGGARGVLPLRFVGAVGVLNGGPLFDDDAVSVKVGGAFDGASSGKYEGVLLVLAQYN